MNKNKVFKEFLSRVREHRKENHWDVCYDPSINLALFSNGVISDYRNDSYTGGQVKNKNISLEREQLSEDPDAPDKSLFLKGVEFECCDFYGNNGGKKMNIENCNFHKCYFSFSEFNDVNFKNCKFESCSFSQSRFYRCSFDPSCEFYKITISGGKTIFSSTEINAIDFFHKIYMPFEERKDEYIGKNLTKERYLLSRSIVKLSRTILNSNQECANDDLYYNALKNLCLNKLEERRWCNLDKINDLCGKIKEKIESTRSRSDKEWWFIFKKSCDVLFLSLKRPFYIFEKFIMSLFGFINNWGGSLQRLFFFGFSLLLSYCFLYAFIDNGFVTITSPSGVIEKIHAEKWYYFLSSLIKSFDVTFLAGYTKHVTSYDSLFKQLVLLSNMLLGLFWYAVAIPSLINKISVTRL